MDMKRILWVILAFGCAAEARDPAYIAVNRDSMAAFSNYAISAHLEMINEDSLFCDRLIPRPKGTDAFSSFTCGESVVREFTFTGYADGFAELLYKPSGSDQAYFGKARIRIDGIGAAYVRKENDSPSGGLSEQSMDKATGALAFTALAVIAIAAIVYAALSQAVGLSPF
jgi:hypothetical protein